MCIKLVFLVWNKIFSQGLALFELLFWCLKANQCQKDLVKIRYVWSKMLLWCSTWNTQCHKVEFCWTIETDWPVWLTWRKDIQEILLRRAGLLGHEGDLTICFHHQQLFGYVFERRAKYCCGVIGSHQRRAQSKKQISLLMAKELKPKGYNVIPGHSLCRQCVKKYIMEGDQNESDAEIRSSITALTLWVSPLSIYSGVLNTRDVLIIREVREV